jgi:hypothetical protein
MVTSGNVPGRLDGRQGALYEIGLGGLEVSELLTTISMVLKLALAHVLLIRVETVPIDAYIGGTIPSIA